MQRRQIERDIVMRRRRQLVYLLLAFVALVFTPMAQADVTEYPVALDFTATASGNGGAPTIVDNGRADGYGYIYWSTFPGAVYGADSHGSAAADVIDGESYTDVQLDIWMLPGYAQMPDFGDPMFPGPPTLMDMPAGGDASVSGTLTVGAKGVAAGTQMLIDITVPTCNGNGDYLEWSCTVKRDGADIATLGPFSGYSDQIQAVAGEELAFYVAANDMSTSTDATDTVVVRFSTTVVPEPATMILLVAGLPLLLKRRRNRN